MRPAQTKPVAAVTQQSTRSSARTLLLVFVCFLLGLAVGAYRSTNRHPPTVDETAASLSEGTKAVLKTLASPVEIRFYSLLDPASTSDSLRAFAERVDQLTSDYEREAGGKIKVVHQTTRSDSAAQAAAADGIKAFNLDKGDACFLGIAVIGKDQKETLAQLSPEWESALESDLSRAIARVSTPKPAVNSAVANAAPINTGVAAEVRRIIPNLDSVSLADGKQTRRVVAFKEILEATEAMQRRVKQAEQQISQAQTNGSEAEQQAAMKQLQQVQAEQTQKLKEISAKLQDQITALEKLKSK